MGYNLLEVTNDKQQTTNDERSSSLLERRVALGGGIADVAVVVVSWNTRTLLLACLASLPAALGDVQADIWVVDNQSNDGSVAAVQMHFPTAHIIQNQDNNGFAAANNQAIAASTSRYVLLLNSDTIATPGSIQALVRFADQHLQAGVVGAMLLNPDGTFQASFADFPSLGSELLSVTGVGPRLFGRWYPNYGPNQSQATRQVDWVQGACMLARRVAIESAGPMDDAYFMYNEEIDWCRQFAQAGWEIWYLAEAHIVHYGGQSTRQIKQAMVQALYRSKVRFFRKHYGPTIAALLQGLFVLVLNGKWLLRTLAALHRPANPGTPFAWRDLNVLK